MYKCCYTNPEGKSCQFTRDNIFDDLFYNTSMALKTGNTQHLSDSLEFQYQWKGKPYCIFHLPLAEKSKWNNEQRYLFARTQSIASQTYNNFEGTNFVAAGKITSTDEIRYGIRSQRTLNLRYCAFGEGVAFRCPNCSTGYTFLDHSTFLGNIEFFDGPMKNISFDSCKFLGSIIASGGQYISSVTFIDSIFKKTADFRGREFSESSSFRSAVFNGPARFEDCSLSQGTDFTEAKFKKGAIKPELEPSFRSIRKAMGENKNHPMEGKFYALEQRCNRKKYPWYSPTKWFSCLYDWTSEYGTSPGRAGLVLFFLQTPFWAFYSKLQNTHPLTPSGFTFAQIFKPFELFSYKSLAYEPVKSLIESNPALPFITSLHSILTFSLFAIFLLALRWRFRKG